MNFTGIQNPEEFRIVTRAHIIAWRDDLLSRSLSSMSIRHRLAAISSLFEYLCEKNTVTHNPVKGVKRPAVESYEGKTPAIGDHQARELLNAPDGSSLKGKRDRAILATLLYHALRRDELCKLKVKDFKQERRGVPHIKISGKGGKTRYVPLHPAASGLIHDYLDAAGHGLEDTGHYSVQPVIIEIRNHKNQLRQTVFISWYRNTLNNWDSRSAHIRYAQRRPPMHWIIKQILRKCKNGWVMPILLLQGFMIIAKPDQRIVQRLRLLIEFSINYVNQHC